MIALERGGGRDGDLRQDTRVLGGRGFVGHGIGRDMHEDPQVPNFVSRQLRRQRRFPPGAGLVIAVEPMVNMGTKRVRTLADHWTQVDGRRQAERPFRAYGGDHGGRPAAC